jgi:hypothetical protein
VVAFSWQLLHDRLPTRDNLVLRHVIQQAGSDGNCVWCDGGGESSSSHLFLHCNVALKVWYAIFNWLGVVIVMPPNLFILFECLSETASSKKGKNCFRLVWHSVIWVIWLARNNVIFNNVIKEPLEIIEDDKVISWKWSAVRLKILPCLFYEWCWDPGNCFLR